MVSRQNEPHNECELESKLQSHAQEAAWVKGKRPKAELTTLTPRLARTFESFCDLCGVLRQLKSHVSG